MAESAGVLALDHDYGVAHVQELRPRGSRSYPLDGDGLLEVGPALDAEAPWDGIVGPLEEDVQKLGHRVDVASYGSLDRQLEHCPLLLPPPPPLPITAAPPARVVAFISKTQQDSAS